MGLKRVGGEEVASLELGGEGFEMLVFHRLNIFERNLIHRRPLLSISLLIRTHPISKELLVISLGLRPIIFTRLKRAILLIFA
jgi:hypothetical protein